MSSAGPPTPPTRSSCVSRCTSSSPISRGSPGTPRSNSIVPQREPGEHRLYVGLDGGNAGAFVEVGALTAVPGSDYLIVAQVRTAGLVHAGARVEAYFIDASGNRIDASIVRSPPVRSGGRWEDVAVRLPGDFPNAAWIGLQVVLAQPQPDPQPALGGHELIYQDVKGQAWFDNISIWQVPHLSVRTQSPVNVVRDPVRPELTMRVRDLSGRALHGEVIIYDHQQRPVDHARQDVGKGAPRRWVWQPSLTRYGWYLAILTVYDQGSQNDTKAPVARWPRAASAFLWLPDEADIDEAEAVRFGLAAEGLSQEAMDLIPQMLQATAMGSVVLSAWDIQTDPDNLAQRQSFLEKLIQTIAHQQRQVVLNLSPVPAHLAAALDIDVHSPLSIFDGPSKTWLDYLAPVLMRHGQAIEHWQLGSVDRPEAFYIKDLPQYIGAIYDDFRDLAPRPTIVTPWRLDQDRREIDQVDVAYAVDVPFAVMPDRIADHYAQWHQPPAGELWAYLREPSATELSHDRRVEDLALRILHAWEAGSARLFLSHPWSVKAEKSVGFYPDPLLGVFSNAAHRLAGRTVVGRMPLREGLDCMIFDGPAGGMLAAWNRSLSPDQAGIQMYLGPQPRSTDVWGNQAALPMVEGKHQVALTTKPIFIEGIDPQLAVLRGSMRIEPRFIESVATPHRRELVIKNLGPPHEGEADVPRAQTLGDCPEDPSVFDRARGDRPVSEYRAVSDLRVGGVKDCFGAVRVCRRGRIRGRSRDDRGPGARGHRTRRDRHDRAGQRRGTSHAASPGDRVDHQPG